jgi:hypothetical protein
MVRFRSGIEIGDGTNKTVKLVESRYHIYRPIFREWAARGIHCRVIWWIQTVILRIVNFD